jgi:hypothetical protein
MNGAVITSNPARTRREVRVSRATSEAAGAAANGRVSTTAAEVRTAATTATVSTTAATTVSLGAGHHRSPGGNRYSGQHT